MTPFEEELYRLNQELKSDANAFTSSAEDAGNATQKIIRFAQKWDFKEKYEALAKEKDQLEERYAREHKEIADKITKTLTKELLPIIDELFTLINISKVGSPIERSLKIILGNFEKFLVRRDGGIIRPQLGEELDPVRHQAVSAEQDPKHHGNTISEIFRYGYFVMNQVVREAEVKVKCGVKNLV